MKRLSASLVVLILVTTIAASQASALTKATPYYVDEMVVSNWLETSGVIYHGKKIPVDTAMCSGLRRYGVKADTYGLDRYTRFKCMTIGADEHSYTVQVSFVTKSGKASLGVYLVRRDY